MFPPTMILGAPTASAFILLAAAPSSAGRDLRCESSWARRRLLGGAGLPLPGVLVWAPVQNLLGLMIYSFSFSLLALLRLLPRFCLRAFLFWVSPVFPFMFAGFLCFFFFLCRWDFPDRSFLLGRLLPVSSVSDPWLPPGSCLFRPLQAAPEAGASILPPEEC